MTTRTTCQGEYRMTEPRMSDYAPSRRALLGLFAGLAGIGLASRASAQVCVDRTKLSAADRSMRLSLNYKDKSPDPKRACGGCAFFSAAQPVSCGRCVMLSGGPVDSVGVCDSWTAKK